MRTEENELRFALSSLEKTNGRLWYMTEPARIWLYGHFLGSAWQMRARDIMLDTLDVTFAAFITVTGRMHRLCLKREFDQLLKKLN